MTSADIRQSFLDFFEERGHKVIPSASLIPENDPSVLFTTAGMHPLVPYLKGESHPLGRRLTDVQKCIRTGDIDEVGDPAHLTFFEMLGYWSLGDYFKKESIRYTFDFYTSVLGFNKEDISVTVFAGDENAPFDQESYDTWKDEIGIPAEKIHKYGAKENWWGMASGIGPCGPCTEMFIDTGKEKCKKNCGPSCDCGKYVEIGNNVFIEFNRREDGSIERLAQKNVDVGLGLERLTMFKQGVQSVYDTDLFQSIIEKIEEVSEENYEKNPKTFRIIADHLRAATFILGDENGVVPSNTLQGYVLRRLIRRAVRYGKKIGAIEGFSTRVAETIIDNYGGIYTELEQNREKILAELNKEEIKFAKSLEEGLRVLQKIVAGKTPLSEEVFNRLMSLDTKKKNEVLREVFRNIKAEKKLEKLDIFDSNITSEQFRDATLAGKEAFDLYQSHGFPIEMIIELVQENRMIVDIEEFEKEFKRHQELSHTASAGIFKGGLADSSEETVKLHTAAHLLLASLRQVLGNEHGQIAQKGSNITAERLRFDFNYPNKLTDEQIKKVEDLVNKKIQDRIEVKLMEMGVGEAKNIGATAVYDLSKYGDRVKVYKIGDFSLELCGGPHVKNTGELGHFRIIKEESSSGGVRRIKAVLE